MFMQSALPGLLTLLQELAVAVNWLNVDVMTESGIGLQGAGKKKRK